MSVVEWSTWYPLNSQPLAMQVPDSPGVYEIRTDFEFGRLKGCSQTVYIGLAKKSLKQRLSQRVNDPDRYLTMAEKLLRKKGHILELSYATALDGLAAKHLEDEILKKHVEGHWEHHTIISRIRVFTGMTGARYRPAGDAAHQPAFDKGGYFVTMFADRVRSENYEEIKDSKTCQESIKEE